MASPPSASPPARPPRRCAILNLARAGDNIVSSSRLYGGTYNLFTHTLPKIGITTTYVDGSDPSAFGRAINEKTKAVFLELIGNPRLDVHDLASIADVAHARGVPVIVDNTFAPLLAQPIKHGADIVIHSATKWIGGHGTAIGGVVVDGGTFDWAASERFKAGLRRPRPVATTASATRRPSGTSRSSSSCASRACATSARRSARSTRSCSCRASRRCRCGSPATARTRWRSPSGWRRGPRSPGSATRASSRIPSHKLAKQYLTGGFGGIVTFGVKGGVEAGRRLIDNVQIFSLLANVGDAKSLIIHPASTTHSQLEPEEQASTGVDRRPRPAVGRPRARRRPHRRPRRRRSAAATADALGRRRARRRGRMTLDVRDDPAGRPLRASDRDRPARDRSLGPVRARRTASTLPELIVAYRHDGPPPGRAPQVLVVHALTGSADAAGDWWEPLIGPGRALDTDRVGVLSRQPARRPLRHDRPDLASIRGPGGRTAPAFPAVSTRDQAAAQWRLLDALGIDAARRSSSVARSAGWSRSRSPLAAPGARSRTVMPIAAPAATGPMAVAWNHIQIELIDRLGLDGLALARQLAMTTYRSEADFDERFGRDVRARRPAVDRQLPRPPGPQARRPVRPGDLPRSWPGRWTATTSARVAAGSTRRSAALAAGRHPADRGRHRGRHPVRPAPGPGARRRGARRRASDARYREIRSTKGHDAFLVEWDQLTDLLREALEG